MNFDCTGVLRVAINCITAYHGTNKHSYSKIQKSGFIIPKYTFTTIPRRGDKIPGDLGAGLYAFENSAENAKKFSEKFGDKSDVVVCELQLEVSAENILNMNEQENLDYFNDVRNSSVYQNLYKRFEIHFRNGSRRKCLDGLIIEHILLKAGDSVHLVKKDTFTLFDNDILVSQYANGKEVCIRNKEIIKKHVAI